MSAITSRHCDSFSLDNPQPGLWPDFERELLSRMAKLPDQRADAGRQRYHAAEPDAGLRAEVLGYEARDHGTEWRRTHKNQNE